MVEKEPEVTKIFNRSITRRQAIKAGGIAAVGLAFAKPAIDTFFPKPAFAKYVQVGNPSIQWVKDDLEFPGTAALSMVTVTATLQDASTPPADPYFADVKFKAITMDALNNFVGLSIKGTPVLVGGPGVSVGAFDIPSETIDVEFKVTLIPNGGKVQLKIEATVPGGKAEPDLTLTFDP